MRIASEEWIKTIAFSNISTEVYRLLKEIVAKIVYNFFTKISKEKTSVEEARLTCFMMIYCKRYFSSEKT